MPTDPKPAALLRAPETPYFLAGPLHSRVLARETPFLPTGNGGCCRTDGPLHTRVFAPETPFLPAGNGGCCRSDAVPVEARKRFAD